MSSAMSSSNLPFRQTGSKHHAHSVSVGSVSQTHRVTRRKSMTSTNAANVAAMAAAVRDAGDMPPLNVRKGVHSKTASEVVPKVNQRDGDRTKLHDYPSPPSSLPNNQQGLDATYNGKLSLETGEVIDETTGGSNADGNKSSTKARMRRASEGSPLIKGDGKRVSGGELRCEKCGKGYKHSSCLTKHLWEHTPEWSYTSKLLISKHQQVQLLEAASVLVAMNQDPTTPPDSARDFSSEHSSASPAASASPELRDDISSTDTTPPPQGDDHMHAAVGGQQKRNSGRGLSTAYSHEVLGFGSLGPGSVPSTSSNFSHVRHTSSGARSTASIGAPSLDRDDEAAGLAAAVELLSCSFGTPRSGPTNLPPDVPPVPPLPARFLGANINNLSGATATPYSPQLGVSSPHDHSLRSTLNEPDINMDEGEESSFEDDGYDQRSARGRSDEEDDGVFGRMEE
ncbi:MAG: hypothetical protein M1817_004832 [Caeruleum heppii]|nr:MAG: hypothetical protein M1817_004832 [Caeruleum heppii]